jgi:peptide/nickel transport system substrate-binding protein
LIRGRGALVSLLAVLLLPACRSHRLFPEGMVVVAMPSAPNTLDPRVGTDDFSYKAAQLVFDRLLEWDEHLRVAPGLAERLEHPDPLTYVAHLRRDVRFHDGHELTAADVVYTFRSFLDPEFTSGLKGSYRELQAVDAIDRYTVRFTLSRPFPSFPINLVAAIVPDGAPRTLGEHPIGTGPYRFVRYLADDRLELASFPSYFKGAPRNAGVVLKIVPDDVMRGLELRNGSIDLVVNDLAPDTVRQLERVSRLKVVTAPGVDYQYIGLNLRDPLLQDARVRQALAFAIDREAIVQYLRRGLATPAAGVLPPQSWAATDVLAFPHDPARARALLDEAGFRDPDGDGPGVRFRLALKVSTNEPYRLQAAVIQHDLRQVGIGIDIRSHEFATLYADVLAGNFQLYTLQWTGASLADPDIIRRVFHSAQVPPTGLNRGHFSDPHVDRLLDAAFAEPDETRRVALYHDAQQRIAREVPYVSLWFKTNVAVAAAGLSPFRLSPFADLLFLRDVKRVPYN